MVSGAAAQSTETPMKAYPDVQVKDTTLEYRQFEKVEITGSSIVRKEQTQTLPVQVITRAEIQNSGKNDVAALIQALPLMSSFTSVFDGGLDPQIMINIDGGIAEYVLTPDTQIYPVKDGLNPLHLAFIEPLACSIRGMDLAALKGGESIAVLGGGVIGLLVVQLAKLAALGR